MTSARRSQREADELLNGIIDSLNRLRVRDPNTDDFVCNPPEEDTVMESLTREELLSDSTDLPFTDAAGDKPDDDANNASVQSDTPEQTTQEKVDAIRSVIFMLPEHPERSSNATATHTGSTPL
ncbi:hypothetical protein F444_09548 [Phytophthora nicotianae P1976]|uniref:Uncharacterized protein n=1 Tax=Phytophthora nicotianae P1976 TaxID=1317066 RepID=A0A081A7D7_PHYNI|nr:hypothetical protein F444_09548 [Phytophthora nicotianae P1976]